MIELVLQIVITTAGFAGFYYAGRWGAQREMRRGKR
jgi:hypothetical protein